MAETVVAQKLIGQALVEERLLSEEQLMPQVAREAIRVINHSRSNGVIRHQLAERP